MIDRRQLLALAAAAPVLALGRTTAAQAPSLPGWPNRFVKLVVPFTPGGGIDGIGRILGARLSEVWGQQVVIENKPGAGGNIASEFVARSAPDGYTIYITAAGLAVNRYLFASINYDPLADFAPVTLICLFPNMLVVPNSLPVHSVSDLLALAKKNPGKVTFASPGHGSSPHMSGELFKYLAKVDLTHVPYRGASPAYTDLIAGARRLHVRGHGLGSSARSIRTVARARRDHGRAGVGGAGSSHHRRGWRARLRYVVMVRFLCAGQDAARDHPQDARGHRRRARRAADQSQARCAWRSGGGLYARTTRDAS